MLEYSTKHNASDILITASLKGEAVGSAEIIKTAKKEYSVKNLFIEERYRGFKIASRLLEIAKDELKNRECDILKATFPVNTLGFFKKNGFAVSGVSYEKDGERVIDAEVSFVFGEASWLTFENELEAVIAKKTFLYNKSGERVFLKIAVLGFSEIYVNGKKVSDRLFAPAWSNYNERDLTRFNYPIFDRLTHRIYYEVFDITDLLNDGENTLMLHIGGGWYCQHESKNEGVSPYGELGTCFIIYEKSGTVAKSDESVFYGKSFVTRANIYFGEVQDTRLGNYNFEDPASFKNITKSAEISSQPLAVLREQKCPPDRVIRTITPSCIFRRGDYAVYDIGENVAGFPVIKFKETAHKYERAILRFSEELNADGSLNFDSAGGAFRMQCEEYIYDGLCAELHQHFTWHGARYFDVCGNVDIVCYNVTHTDINKKVDFKSSDPVLSWIFDAFIRTQLSNIHCCVPSDCPHRERLGYTGDGQLLTRAVMTCFDAEDMYRKWLDDIADSQDILTGHVEHTAPFYGGGGGPGGWGGAAVFVPYNFYEFYGDKDVLKKYYPNMSLYLDYMEAHSENGLVTSEEKGGWCLGDWCAPGNKNLLPEPLVNTYFYIKALMCTEETEKFLGIKNEKTAKRLSVVKKAFADAYFDEESGSVFGSIQAADAFGIDIGVSNEKTLDALADRYDALGEFDTGIFGTYLLIKVLLENGKKELAKKLLTNKSENSFYNMMKHGATTLWENWDGVASHSHPMFGAVAELIVKYFNET